MPRAHFKQLTSVLLYLPCHYSSPLIPAARFTVLPLHYDGSAAFVFQEANHISYVVSRIPHLCYAHYKTESEPTVLRGRISCALFVLIPRSSLHTGKDAPKAFQTENRVSFRLANTLYSGEQQVNKGVERLKSLYILNNNNWKSRSEANEMTER